MINQKPDGVTIENWGQTPVEVQEFILQTLQNLATASPSSTQDSNPLLSADTRAGHLLVVDDNEMNRDMLSRRLERHGHTVSLAVNGREALEMVGQEAFDLVLLDIMMPEMNGYEVLERLKQDDETAHIPVVMISAVDEIDSLVRCIKLGAEDYLPKPFNPVLLKARVDASLEKKWLRDHQVAYLQQLTHDNQRKSNELEQAREIQRSMLPTTPPSMPYLDIAAQQDTATEVGGDYYDFFTQPDGSLRIAIGDATGHGVASGLMVSMTKASLMSTNETDLPALIQKINHTLAGIDLGTQLNMALMVLELDQTRGDVVDIKASGGGMPPAFIWRANGTTEEYLISGFPLGIIPDISYSQVEFELYSGDTMLLASDGLSERFNDHQQFLGFDRLTTDLQNIDPSKATADEILRQAAAISDDWGQNHPLHDDITLVVVKVL